MKTDSSVEATLKSVFALNTFRPGQRKVIQSILDGRSALAVFPTGGGKSLCYQLPALLFDGLTVVVSPLIALMKDQVDYLKGQGIKAARLDSSLTLAETDEVKASIENGSLKILYVSPEKLSNERFRYFMRRGTAISLLAIDEAHCVSQWGHNFRPDYLKLARFSKVLEVERILALTATATPQVVADICEAFQIKSNDATVTGFSRPNLHVFFTEVKQDERFEYLRKRIEQTSSRPTIVYVTLQKTAENLAEKLQSLGYLACAYHAGMGADLRESIQERFMRGEKNVIVATIAFGMGIDKSDIRFVFHYNLPKGLESYMQEIGRAGRDGRESFCEVIANGDDVTTLLNFIYGDTPGLDSIQSFLEKIDSQDTEFTFNLSSISKEVDIRPLVLNTLFTYLELDNHLDFLRIEYETYQWKWLVSEEQCLSHFDSARSSFLRKVFASASLGRTIWTLDLKDASANTGEKKERISIALNYLADKKMIDLRLKGKVHRFRKGPNPLHLSDVTAKYLRKFVDREQQEEQRIQAILNLPAENCIMRKVAAYFGEQIDPCGKCSTCLNGRGPRILVNQLLLKDTKFLTTVVNRHKDRLVGARSIARFLCGLPSPRLTMLKLNKHEDFGCFSAYSFKHILEVVSSSLPAK